MWSPRKPQPPNAQRQRGRAEYWPTIRNLLRGLRCTHLLDPLSFLQHFSFSVSSLCLLLASCLLSLLLPTLSAFCFLLACWLHFAGASTSILLPAPNTIARCCRLFNHCSEFAQACIGTATASCNRDITTKKARANGSKLNKRQREMRAEITKTKLVEELISIPNIDLPRRPRKGLTLCVSGAANGTGTTIRNWLRGLRCTQLLGVVFIVRAIRIKGQYIDVKTAFVKLKVNEAYDSLL